MNHDGSGESDQEGKKVRRIRNSPGKGRCRMTTEGLGIDIGSE